MLPRTTCSTLRIASLITSLSTTSTIRLCPARISVSAMRRSIFDPSVMMDLRNLETMFLDAFAIGDREFEICWRGETTVGQLNELDETRWTHGTHLGKCIAMSWYEWHRVYKEASEPLIYKRHSCSSSISLNFPQHSFTITVELKQIRPYLPFTLKAANSVTDHCYGATALFALYVNLNRSHIGRLVIKDKTQQTLWLVLQLRRKRVN